MSLNMSFNEEILLQSLGEAIYEIDLTSIKWAYEARINIDKTEESESSIKVYTSLDNKITWTEVEDDDYIPGISIGQDLTDKNLAIKALFYSDGDITPRLNKLSVDITRLFIFDNDGDHELYPEILIKNLKPGDIKLTNVSDGGREFGFRDIQEEILYIDSENEHIETDFAGVEHRYDDMMGDFLRMKRGRNLIVVDGKCWIKLKYRFILY